MNNADWWSKKLNNNAPQVQQGRPDPSPTMPPSQLPMSQMPVFQRPNEPQGLPPLPSASCPDCRSSNYMSPTPQIAPRCYDCGYPIQQSGSRFGGLAGAHVEGAAKQATGNSGSGGYNPQQIIGRV
jgi:hypothetical protein